MPVARPAWANAAGPNDALAGGMVRLGPQAERNSEWVNRAGEVNAPTEREALVVDALADKRLYEQELGRMRKENAFLEDQVRRVSAELKRHQIRYPQTAAGVAEGRKPAKAGGRQEMVGEDCLPPWVTSSEVMSPLLAAYDARIQDLEGQVSGQKESMGELASRTQQLVDENEQLRQQHVRELDDLVQQAGASGGLGGIGAREMVGELNERINILMAENTVMADQTSAMAKELDAVHEDLDEREAQMAALTKALTEAGLGLRTLEERVPRLEREKAHAEGELMKAVNALSEREAALSEADEKLRNSKDDFRRISSKVSDLETEKNGMERQAENDADVTTERVRAAGRRITELQGLLAARSQEADGNGDRARKLQRELDATRRDAEGMLTVMSGMERQIAELSGREESTSSLAKESKKKVEDALLARDQARALEVQSRRELARVFEARKADAEGHGREMEEVIQAQRNKFTAQLSTRDREIQEVTAQAARLRGEAERAGRDRAGMEEVYTSLKKGVEGEAEAIKARFDDLQARVIEADARRDQQEKEVRELEHASAETERKVAMKEAAFKARESHLQDALRARERELDSIRSSFRGATDHSEKLQREARGLASELEQEREEHSRKLEEEVMTRAALLEEANARSAALERASGGAEKRTAEAEALFAKQLRATQERASAQGLNLERHLREEQELAQRLSSRVTDLQAQLVQLAAERGDFAAAAKRTAEDKGRLEKSLADARRKLAELTSQISETIVQGETRAREEGRLRSELKRLQITAARNERETSSARSGGQQTTRLLSHRMRPLASKQDSGKIVDSGSGGVALDRPDP